MTDLSRLLASAFIASTWQAAVLAAALAAILRAFPRIAAATRFTIWCVALILFALLPFLPASHAAAATHAATIHLAPWWSLAIAILWISLSAFRLVQLVVSAASLHRIARAATPVEHWPFCTAPGTSRTAVLCTSDDVTRPSVLGFFSPRILIPSWLLPKISHEELAQIVLHEMQHLRRRDDWANLLQKLGLVLFPLNPALLWVERRLCLERELACDDGVLRITNAPRAYASALVNLAGQSLVRTRLSLALGAWERRSELATRVHAILRATGSNRRPATALAATLITALLGGGAALSRAPQLVSFADPTNIAAVTAPPLTAPAAYQAVRYNDGVNAPRPTFVKAVMPETMQTTAPAMTAKPGRTHHKSHRPERSQEPLYVNRTSSKTQANQQPRLTLAALNTTSDTLGQAPQTTAQEQQPRVVFTVIQTVPSFRTYAAVPTPDGWLFIQL